jgi:hypothetical protein
MLSISRGGSLHETGKVLPAKIVLHVVHLIFSSSIFSVVGMDQPQTQLFTIMHISLTYTFHKEDTTSQMLGLQSAIYFSFHTEVFGTTWLSEVELQFSEQYFTLILSSHARQATELQRNIQSSACSSLKCD